MDYTHHSPTLHVPCGVTNTGFSFHGVHSRPNFLPSKLALRPDGSSKLHPFSDAPSALEHSIFTPCRFAHWERERCDSQIRESPKMNNTENNQSPVFISVSAANTNSTSLKLSEGEPRLAKTQRFLHRAQIQRGQLFPDLHSTGWHGPGCNGLGLPSWSLCIEDLDVKDLLHWNWDPADKTTNPYKSQKMSYSSEHRENVQRITQMYMCVSTQRQTHTPDHLLYHTRPRRWNAKLSSVALGCATAVYILNRAA